MQATIGCLSRIVTRTFVNNVQQQQSVQSSASSSSTSKETEENFDKQPRLVTAVSGFPKAQASYNIDHILKGQIGDDAYFITRHLDDWNSCTTTSKPASVPTSSSPRAIPNSSSTGTSTPSSSSSPSSSRSSPSPSSSYSNSVESILNPLAALSTSNSATTSSDSNDDLDNPMPRNRRRHQSNSADVIGVADGVGGWRQYGVDPGQFSMQLMQSCERLVNAGYFVSNQPARLLAQGFGEMQALKKPVIGSSTACLAMLCHADGKLYTANIGDSGLLVVRNGQVVHRSAEQQHYFNTPYQLSLPPSEMASDVLADRPEAADRYEFNVEDGDVIVLATDGIFDNVPDALLVEQIESIRGHTNDFARIQACANSIALIARSLSKDEYYLSPFAKNARSSGFSNVTGGKEDDVTVVLAAVNCKSQNGQIHS